MNKFIFSLILLLSLGNSPAFAQLHGDSVMTPTNNPSSSNVSNTSGNFFQPSVTSSNQNEVQYGTCPAGFLYAGGTQFPLQMRTVTTYYLGSQLAGQSASPWYDTDASCSTTQYQSIACPAGYNGTQSQSRLVSTSNGYYDYGAWTTYSSNCVYVPPPPVKKPGSTTIFSVVGWAGWDGAGGDAGASKVAGTFTLALDNATSLWMCSVSAPNSNSYSPGPGNSLPTVSGSSFTCQISGNNVYVQQSCATTSGGDADMCIDAYYNLTITARSGDNCSVTFRQTNGNVWANLGTQTMYLCY